MKWWSNITRPRHIRTGSSWSSEVGSHCLRGANAHGYFLPPFQMSFWVFVMTSASDPIWLSIFLLCRPFAQCYSLTTLADAAKCYSLTTVADAEILVTSILPATVAFLPSKPQFSLFKHFCSQLMCMATEEQGSVFLTPVMTIVLLPLVCQCFIRNICHGQ